MKLPKFKSDEEEVDFFLQLRESLLRDLDNIAIRHGVTKERWIKETIIKRAEQLPFIHHFNVSFLPIIFPSL